MQKSKIRSMLINTHLLSMRRKLSSSTAESRLPEAGYSDTNSQKSVPKTNKKLKHYPHQRLPDAGYSDGNSQKSVPWCIYYVSPYTGLIFSTAWSHCIEVIWEILARVTYRAGAAAAVALLAWVPNKASLALVPHIPVPKCGGKKPGKDEEQQK